MKQRKHFYFFELRYEHISQIWVATLKGYWHKQYRSSLYELSFKPNISTVNQNRAKFS